MLFSHLEKIEMLEKSTELCYNLMVFKRKKVQILGK